MWTVKVEPMTENPIDGEERLWKVAVYENGKYMNNQAEGLPYEKAVMIAKDLQENFDEQNRYL